MSRGVGSNVVGEDVDDEKFDVGEEEWDDGIEENDEKER